MHHLYKKTVVGDDNPHSVAPTRTNMAVFANVKQIVNTHELRPVGYHGNQKTQSNFARKILVITFAHHLVSRQTERMTIAHFYFSLSLFLR